MRFSLPLRMLKRSALNSWNLRAIHADATCGERATAATARRARGWRSSTAAIVTNHIDSKANLNLALSKSFVPTEPNLNPPPGFTTARTSRGIIAAPVNGIGVQRVRARSGDRRGQGAERGRPAAPSRG